MIRLVFLGCMAYLAVGFGQLAIGTVMEPMVNAYGIHYADGGQLVMHQFAGGLVGVLLTPWLIARMGKKGLLLSALALIIVGEAVYLMLPPWEWMLAAAPVAGLGLGITEAVIASFIIGASTGNANRSMSQVEVFFSLGALLLPFAGYGMISGGYWLAVFGVVGGITAVVFILWLLLWPPILNGSGGHAADLEASTNGSNEASASDKPRMRMQVKLALTACALFFILYVGFEMSVIHYLPSILVQNNGVAESTAALSLSVLWGAMTLGRMVSGHMADRWGGAKYLLGTSIAAVVLFVLMGAVDSVSTLFVLTFCSGLAFSGMFAIALVFANRVAPGMTDRTTSLMLACGGLGGALLPRLTGWFLDVNGADATKWLFAVMAAILLTTIVWAVLAEKRARIMAIG